MGLSVLLLLSAWNEVLRRKLSDISDGIESAMARSISFGSSDHHVEAILRTPSFNKKDLNDDLGQTPKYPQSQALRKSVPLKDLVVEKENNEFSSEPVSDQKDHDTNLVVSPALVAEPFVFTSPRPIHELEDAAIKLQKVYKSYRTRRNVADWAVVVEELWWKTLDSAALDRSSISFFNSTEQETAVSRWCRAKKRAAKVGKGLLKDEKAQKLALHHWLEAIDPRHRYGRNLHFYYDVWTERKSHQPFFYWLDIGDGKEVNLPSCPRVDLQRECIQYLGPKERESYEVIMEEGKLIYKQSGTFLNTDETTKWIFVLSTSRVLYVGKKKKGLFQHSSFLSGGVTTAAGRLVAHDGILEKIWPYSGHYLPTEDNFQEFISFLEEHHVDMSNVQRCSIEDDSPSFQVTEDESSSKLTTDDGEISTTPNMDETVVLTINRASNGSIAINTAVDTDGPKLDLPKTLSCKWASGVGPRIGCVRDYPTELQSQALEKLNLSPTVDGSPRYPKTSVPIPSPRPSPNIRVSPRLASMGLPSPSPRLSSLSTAS